MLLLRMIKYTKIILSTIFIIIFIVPAFSKNITLKKTLKEKQIGIYIECLEDKKNKLTLHDVQSEENQKLWFKTEKKNPGFGFTKSIYWVRFTIENIEDEEMDFYLEQSYPLIDDITLFIQGENETSNPIKTGDLLPFKERPYDHRTFIFPLNINAKSSLTYYMRYKSSSSMSIILNLWSSPKLSEHVMNENRILLLYYGIMLVMIIYNLFVYLSIRSSEYLYYVLFIIFFIIFIMTQNGTAFQFLWPNYPWFGNFFIPVSLCLCIIFGFLFSIKFLDVRKMLPILLKVSYVLLAITGVVLIFDLFLDYGPAIVASASIAGIIIPFGILIGFRLCLKRHRPAYFYTSAWLVFFIGSLLYILKSFGILPTNVFTQWGIQIGSTAQVILLSLALGDRINIMRKELEILNTGLEQLVEERTENLNIALEDLQAKDKIIQTELDLASDIQQGILPPNSINYNGLNIVSFYRSMEKIGGDFYDIFPMRDDHIGILIADVSGHGIPAAFVTAIAKLSFTQATQKSMLPRDILIHVNETLLDTVKTQEYLTAFLLIISPAYEVIYSNASHQKTIIYRTRTETIESWDTNGLFVGAVPEANKMYEEKIDYLDFGDRLFMYTDGLLESRNPEGEDFGMKRLHEAFLGSVKLPIHEARDFILEKWEEFTNENESRDDVTFIIIEVNPDYKKLITHRDTGLELLEKKNPEKAILELKEALQIDERDAKVHYLLARCYNEKQDYKEVVKHMSIYLEKNDDDFNAWYQLSAAYYNDKDFENAITAAQKSCRLNNKYTSPLVVWGLSLKNLKKSEEAKNVWETLIRIDPKNQTAISELDSIKNKN